MKVFKRLFAIAISAVVAATVALLPVQASNAGAPTQQNVGLSYEEPKPLDATQVQPRDGNIPGLGSEWDLRSKGTYSFSGSSSYGNSLYSSYWIKGATLYRIQVKNQGSFTLRVRFKNYVSTFASTYVPAGQTVTFYASMPNADKGAYLLFEESGSYSVSGTVSKA